MSRGREWIRAMGLLSALMAAFGLISPEGTASEPPVLYLGGGAISQYPGLTSDSATGATGGNNLIMAAVILSADCMPKRRLSISPLVGYTPSGRTAPDGGSTARLLPIAVRGVLKLQGPELRLGPGILVNTISGKGGTITQNNGTSTSVFALPSKSAESHIFIWDAGVGLKLWRLSIDLDAWVSGAFSSRRAVSWLASASVGIF